MRDRPVFWPQLATFFTNLRVEKRWGQRQAAKIAENRGLTILSRQQLLRLEKGQTKDPDADVLRAVASLYELPYEEVVRRLAVAKYGVNLASDDFTLLMQERFGGSNRFVLEDREPELIDAWRASTREGQRSALTVLKASKKTAKARNERQPQQRPGRKEIARRQRGGDA